ncbi:MAG: homoserine kinase, partial [Pseudomonadota bacterium]
MAVYTDISDEELEALLTRYDLGAPLAFKGIAEGVENSNFLL